MTRRESWNPLLKSYPQSEKVNSLSFQAETLFTRLLAQADDFGNYWWDASLILAYLFGHRMARGELDVPSAARIRDELVTCALATRYEVEGKEYLHLVNCHRKLRGDVKADERFPREPIGCESAIPTVIPDTARARSVDVPNVGRTRDENEPLDPDPTQPRPKSKEKTPSPSGEAAATGKPKSASLTAQGKAGGVTGHRKQTVFPAEAYTAVTEAYKRLKGIAPQGDEWKPIQQGIKTMFRSGRSPEEIVRFMEALAQSDLTWASSWTLDTVRKKLPEFLAGKLKLRQNGGDPRRADAVKAKDERASLRWEIEETKKRIAELEPRATVDPTAADELVGEREALERLRERWEAVREGA